MGSNKAQRRDVAHRRLPAYSLLEVGIVLLIIGVLVGGLLKGTTLLDTAKVTNLGNQYTAFRVAVHGFMDTYGHLPGDMPNASQKLGEDQRDGDGDGTVSGGPWDVAGEAHHFWRHLRVSKWLEGQPLSEAPYDNLPTSKLGGLWGVEHNPPLLIAQRVQGDSSGLWFVLGRPSAQGTTRGVLTPRQAQMMINKYDDGRPDTGHIRIVNGASSPEGSAPCLRQDGTLDLTQEEGVCVAYFRV